MHAYVGKKSKVLTEMKFSIFSKWMYRNSTIRNLFNSLSAFSTIDSNEGVIHTFLTCYFVILPDLMDVLSLQLSFGGNPNFVNKLPLFTFNIQFMYDNLKFSFSICNKLHPYFVTFLLHVRI